MNGTPECSIQPGPQALAAGSDAEMGMTGSDGAMTPEEIATLAKAARLPLAAARRRPVADAVSMVLGQLDALDAVDLGETPPTNAFDARWRTRT